MKYLMRPKDKKTIQLTGQRESLIEDANVLEDFKNLFSSLFQGIGRRSKKSLYDTGEGSKGIIEIILLYYKFNFCKIMCRFWGEGDDYRRN